MVTTAPIPFQSIPRTVGSVVADAVAVQNGQADKIDYDFDLIKNYANGLDANTTVTYVPNPIATPGSSTWTLSWTMGLVVGDLRVVGFQAAYNSSTAITATGGGNIPDQYLMVLTDSRFFIPSGTYLTFPVYLTYGTGIVEINSAQEVILRNLSYTGQGIALNSICAGTFDYMVR